MSKRRIPDGTRRARGTGAGAPRVSIIMPYLDPPEPFITEAVESVVAQEYDDWELLLANDGSGPAARATAQVLAARDPRIRLVSHEDGLNRGIPATRNMGMRHARGEFYAFLDSDDAWYPHKLGEQVRLLDGAPHVDMVFGRSLYWKSWQAGTTARDRPPPLRVRDRTEMGRGEFLRRMLTARVMVPCPSSILVRAEAARAVGGFQADVSNLYEDQAFYAKVSLRCTVLACAEVWDRYRLHGGSVISSATSREALDARRQFFDWLSGYVLASGHEDPTLRRALRLERWAIDIPRGPRLLRSLRKAAALPGLLLQRLPAGVPGSGVAR
jgi:glycosyltransferase involved in cell wall biosynthesis